MKNLLLWTFIFLAQHGQVLQGQDMSANGTDTTKVSTNVSSSGIQNLYETDQHLWTGAGPTLHPQAYSFVKDYMEDHTPKLLAMKGWAMPYFNMMDGILTKYGLPNELKYLAVIESNLKSSAVSWAGAVGPWQFMPATAVRMGLKVNSKIDERTNYVKSTHAAAKYLKELYGTFGDWLLVIAAYNGGPGNVQKAIRKSGSTDFWKLQYYLPAESRKHVKKFIGTHYVFEGQGGLTTLTKAEVSQQYGTNGVGIPNRNISPTELAQLKKQSVSGKYHSLVIAKNILMPIHEFNRYNPGFDKAMASAGNKYELQLPTDKMELFNANKYQILQESVQLLLSGNAPPTSMAQTK
jgi:membrane-bound lytic murein transglycosylase D